MAEDGKNGSGRGITVSENLEGKVRLDIKYPDKEVAEVYVSDSAGQSRPFYPAESKPDSDIVKTQAIELEVARKFRRIRDMHIPDNGKITLALEYLLEKLSPKYALLSMGKTELPGIDSRIRRIRDNGVYRDATKTEHDEITKFKNENLGFTIDVFKGEGITYHPNIETNILGGLSGEGFTAYLKPEGIEFAVAGLQFLGTKKLDKYDKLLIDVWVDEADTLFNEILNKREEISEGVIKDIKEREFKNQEKDIKPFELASDGDRGEQTTKADIDTDKPGRGYQIGSLFDTNKITINSKYGSMVGKDDARPNDLSFTIAFGMPLPEKLYDNKSMLNVSELSAKLTLAVMKDAVETIFAKSRDEKRAINMGKFKGEDYKAVDYNIAAVFTALYVLSPKYMKTGNVHMGEDSRPLFPKLQKEWDLDKISTRFAVMLSPEGMGYFNTLQGKEKRVGELITDMSTKMDSKAESYITGGRIDMVTYITNVIEACRHYANYVLESDLKDKLDKDAGLAHKAIDGIRYLMKVGYGDYASLIARSVLREEDYIGFQEERQEQSSGGNKADNSPRIQADGVKANVPGNIVETVRGNPSGSNTDKGITGYESGPVKLNK